MRETLKGKKPSKGIREAQVDGKHISDDEEAILEPAAVNEQPPIEEGQYDQKYRDVAENAFRAFLSSLQDEKVVRNGNVQFHGEDVEMSWELDEEELKKYGNLAPILRGLELAFFFYKNPADRKAAGYFHRQNGSQPNKIVVIPDAKNWDFTKLLKLARTAPRKFLGMNVHHKVFVHEFTHYLDFLRHKSPEKFGATASRPEYSQYGTVYHNDPHEMNAFYQQAAADVERVAARLGGKWSKVWEDPKTFFEDAVLPHMHPGHWDNLNAQNKKRILKRSYQLWQDLKRRHPTKEASHYLPGPPPKEGGARRAPFLNIDEANALDGEVVKKFQDKLTTRGIHVTGERIGFGSQASVFPVGKDRVLKVTEDRSDALAMNIVKSRDLKHVARVFDVFKFPPIGGSERWGIVTERLVPIPKKQAYALSEAFVGCYLTQLTNTDAPMGDWKSTLAQLRKLQSENSEEKRDFDGSLALLERFQIPDIIDELHRYGIECRDFHPDNIMVRPDGSYAMVDLGFSTSRGAKEPPVLEHVVIPRRSLLEAAGASAEGHTGTFFALKVPPDVAEKLAIPGGEAPEKLHVTLFYKKGLTDEQRKSAATVFIDACKKLAGGGVPVKLGGVGRFSASPGSDGKDVIYASVDSPFLQSIRQSMAMQWQEEGIDPDVEHAFVPHVTLAYVDAEAQSPVHRLDPVQFKSTKAIVKEAVTREDVFVVRTAQVLKKKGGDPDIAKKKKATVGLVKKAVVRIPHLDELSEADFDVVVRSLRDGTAVVTEKVDGAVHVRFGLDAGGLWMGSKHGVVARSPDDHVGPGSGALRWAHRALEGMQEGLSKAWPLGALYATADVLDGPRPNVLPYSRTGLAVHGLYDRRGMRVECPEMFGISKGLFEVPRLDGKFRGASLDGKRPVVQEALVRSVAGVRSAIGPGPVEGVVIRTPEGVVTKVVDRLFFTALNSNLWGPREALDRGEVRGGRRVPGVLERFRRSVTALAGVPVLNSHHVVEHVRKSGHGDVDAMLEGWSRTAGAFARDGSLDEARALARKTLTEVDGLWTRVSARFSEGFGVFLVRADGSSHSERVDMSHPVVERTALAFDDARSWLAALAESKTPARFIREFVGPVRLARIREDVNGPPPSSPSQVIERYRQLLSKKGIEPNLKRSLGSGFHGEVYELAAHGKVLKVTDDEDEARAAQHVKGKTLKHVVHVFDVFSFPGATWFGVVVEKLRELPEQTKEVLTRLNGRSMNYAGEGDLNPYDRFLSDVAPDDRAELEKMKFREMYDELARNKILYSDWHGGNVMTRTGQEFVLADLGGETVSPGKTPPVIEKRVTEGGKTGSIGVTVGRFQPFHRGHGELVRQLARKFDRVVVIVGGSKGGERNPFSWKTRLDLMKKSLPDVWGKVIVRPATYEGRPSGFVPGVLSDMSKEKGSPIKSDTSFQVLVGPDRVDDVRHQFERAPEGLGIDPSLVSVEEMPEIKSPSGKSVSGTDVREALRTGDEARLKELLDPQLVSNEHDFHEVVKVMKSEMGLREDISKTATAAKGNGGLERVGGVAGVMASLNAHASQLLKSPWRIDVKSLRRLGSGMDGVAFDMGGNKVLKVTGDLPEAFSANSLVGKPARRIVKIFDVFRFPAAGSGRMKDADASPSRLPGERRLGLFGIVEEKLTPLSDKEKVELDNAVTELDREVKFFSRVRALRPWKDIVGEMRSTAGAPAQRPVSALEPADVAGSKSTVVQRAPSAVAANKERGKNVRVEEVEKHLKTLEKFDVGAMHDELLNYGIEFSDFHGGNVMKRGSEYVINDLGRSGGTGQRPPRNLEHIMREEIRRLVEQVDQEAAVDAVLRNGDGLKALLGTDAEAVVETVRDRDGQSYFFVKGKELRVSDDEFAAFVLPLVGKKGVALVNVFHAFSLDEGLSAAVIERGLEPLSAEDGKELTSVIAFLDRATKGGFSRDFGKKVWKELIGSASKELARYASTMAVTSTKDVDAAPRALRKVSGVRDVQDTSQAVAASIVRFNLPRMSEELRAAGLSVTLRSDSLRIRPDGSVLFFYGADRAASGARLPTLKALNSSVGKRVRSEAAFTVGSAHVGLRAGSSAWSSPRGSASPRAKSRRTAP